MSRIITKSNKSHFNDQIKEAKSVQIVLITALSDIPELVTLQPISTPTHADAFLSSKNPVIQSGVNTVCIVGFIIIHHY